MGNAAVALGPLVQRIRPAVWAMVRNGTLSAAVRIMEATKRSKGVEANSPGFD